MSSGHPSPHCSCGLPLSEHRNSEGLTPAGCWRKSAQEREYEADALIRQASMLRSSAFTCRRMADDWEAEHHA